jgi:hypothetical protein
MLLLLLQSTQKKYNFRLRRADKEATLSSELSCFQTCRRWDFLDVPLKSSRRPRKELQSNPFKCLGVHTGEQTYLDVGMCDCSLHLKMKYLGNIYKRSDLYNVSRFACDDVLKQSKLLVTSGDLSKNIQWLMVVMTTMPWGMLSVETHERQEWNNHYCVRRRRWFGPVLKCDDRAVWCDDGWSYWSCWHENWKLKRQCR